MPFKSQAQRRKFAQLLVEGKISPETYEEWNRETGSKKLPDHVTGTKTTKGKRLKATKGRRAKATKGTGARTRVKTAGRAKTAKPKRRPARKGSRSSR